MNLLEAIASQQDFRRAGQERWYTIYESYNHTTGSVVQLWCTSSSELYPLSILDLTASDWETQEPEVILTRSGIRDRLFSGFTNNQINYITECLFGPLPEIPLP